MATFQKASPKLWAFLCLPALDKKAMHLPFRQSWTQAIYKSVYSQNSFSKHSASVLLQLSVDVPLTSLNQHGSWWGTGCIHIQLGRRKRGQDLELPPIMLVCSSITEQNYSVSQFSYKRDNSNLSSLSPSLQLFQLQIFAFSERSTSRTILHLSYNLFLMQ